MSLKVQGKVVKECERDGFSPSVAVGGVSAVSATVLVRELEVGVSSLDDRAAILQALLRVAQGLVCCCRERPFLNLWDGRGVLVNCRRPACKVDAEWIHVLVLLEMWSGLVEVIRVGALVNCIGFGLRDVLRLRCMGGDLRSHIVIRVSTTRRTPVIILTR